MNKILTENLKNHPFASLFWICFLLLIPFIFSTNLLDEDNLPKLTILSVLITILSIRSLVYSPFRSFDRPLLILILIILAYFSFSFMRADNFSSGISALFTMLLPFCLLLLIRANRLFKSELIYFFLPVAAILLCVFAIVQYIMLSTPDFKPVHLIRASMGNKNFLSEALVIYFVFCLSGAINNLGTIRKLNVAALALILLTILLLQSLTAYLCLAFFVIVTPFFFLLFTEKARRRIILFRFLLPGFVVIFFSAFLFMRTEMFKPVKDKIEYAVDVVAGNPLQSTNDGRQNSIFERLYLWKNSMKLFSESPMFGIGLSNWQIYWPKYGMQGASHLDSAIMRYEHPHNEYVLLMTESGIIGLLCFASFFIYILLLGFRIVFSKMEINKKKTVFLMLSGIISIAIISFFGYPFHRPYTAALCMLLCLFIIEYADELSPLKKISGKLPGILIVIFSFQSVNIFANRLSGEYNMTKALLNQSNGNFGGMLRMLRKADNKYFTLDNSSTPLDWYKGFAMFYLRNDSAMFYYQRAEEQNPYHVQTLSDIGAILENQGKHEEAIAYFNKVISFVPGYYHAHYNLAVAYFNLGKPADALREINAKTNIGYDYLNTLDAILARNANVAADSCGRTTIANTMISDKLLLRKINTLAIEKKVKFNVLFCDSIVNYGLRITDYEY